MAGRPKGSRRQVIDVEGAANLYGKPQHIAGRWRVYRWPRESPADGSKPKRTMLTLPHATSFGEAYDDALAIAKAEAAAIAKAAAIAALPPEQRPTDPLTLAEAWTRRLDYLIKIANNRPATLRLVRTIQRWSLREIGEEKPIAEIGQVEVEKLVKSIETRSGSTRLAYVAEMRRLFDYFVRGNFLHANPIDTVPIPKAWRDLRRESALAAAHPLTEAEARKLLAAAAAPYAVNFRPDRSEAGSKVAPKEWRPPAYLRVAIGLGLLAGLRQSNIFGRGALRWSDLDLKEGAESLAIDSARMKSKRTFRVPINCELATLLRAHWHDERERIGHVPHKDDRVIASVACRKAFESLVKRLGLDISWHDLRRSFAGLLAASAPYFVVERLLDHAPSSTITHTYVGTAVPDDVLREHLNRLPSLLDATTQRPAEKIRKAT